MISDHDILQSAQELIEQRGLKRASDHAAARIADLLGACGEHLNTMRD